MYVKVFIVLGYDSIEPTIQRWLNANPKIKIEGITQSAAYGADDPTWSYVVTIIYSIQ